MRVADRYIASNFAGPLVFCTMLFVTMFVFVDSLNNLDEFIKQHTPMKLIAAYYGALIPLVIQQIMPAAVLFAALYSLGHLNRNHEITAFKAGGVSGARVLRPVLVIGFIVSLGMLAMSETVAPQAAVTSSAIKEGLSGVGGSEGSTKSLKNVTLIAAGNRMVYARELRIDTNTLYEVIVLEHNADLSLQAKTTARRAVWKDGSWTFYDGMRYEVDDRGDVIGKPYTFDSAAVTIAESPLEFIRQGTETHFMNYRQLRGYISNTRIKGAKASSRLMAELHHKIAAPFACFIILLVGAPSAMRVRRGGALVSLGMGLGIVTLYYFAVAVSMALGKGGVLPPAIAAWAPHAGFFAFGLYLVWRRS